MTKTIVLMIAAMILGLVSNAQAIPILGHVDLGAGYNPSSTTSGTATYTFSNVDNPITDFRLTGLSLAFEGDVFNLNATSVASFPAGWNLTTYGIGNYYEWEFAYVGVGLPGIPEGEALTFTVNYVLLGLPGTLSWDEGGAWEQAFGVALNNFPIPVPGGSTSPTPEPTSILLLGSGLAGLGLLGRRRFRARSKS